MAGVPMVAHDGEDDAALWLCVFRRGDPGGWGLHAHRQHQVAWVAEGITTAVVDGRRWLVSPSRAMWIPGGAPHDLHNRADARLICLYIWPEHCPVDWREPRHLPVTPLVRELLLGLGEPGLELPVSAAAATVLFDQFGRHSHEIGELPLPVDGRAAELAHAVLARPAGQQTLDDWARDLAVSASTLRRTFLAETGMTFSEWRTRARLEVAASLLASGAGVGTTARRVGYGSRSGFVDAFRRHFGHAPSGHRVGGAPRGERAAVEIER